MTIFVNVLLAIVVALSLCLFLSRRLLESARWGATVTPLASIIGSGFLVSIPLLSNAVGNAAIYAMAGLVLYAFWVGGAIRFNILYGEPIFEAHAANPSARLVLLTERVSQIALACAYFVSVAYYLSLLSLFFVEGIGTRRSLDGASTDNRTSRFYRNDWLSAGIERARAYRRICGRLQACRHCGYFGGSRWSQCFALCTWRMGVEHIACSF